MAKKELDNYFKSIRSRILSETCHTSIIFQGADVVESY